MTYDAVIIGGGLAGCAAATHLARRGLAVLLLEKQRYPVHKLCGEFLSVEVAASLERLGVLAAIQAAGAHPIDAVTVTTAGGAVFESALPGTALGLSRYRLDPLLFDHARRLGAEAHDGTAVRAVTGSLDDGFAVETAEETFAARVVLGAYGKRGLLDRKLDRPFLKKKEPYVAFKAHYEGVSIPGRIELHAFPGGYCGLSHVEDGRINACWIAHGRTLRAAGGDADVMIAQSLTQNAALARRFAAMRRTTDGFLALSQISFDLKGRFDGDLCMIGDTAGMIAPMCGDGMAMALRSAEMAAPLAAAFCAGHLAPEAFRHDYTAAWNREFRLRLRLGRWMHAGYVRPAVAHAGVRAVGAVPPLGRWLIRATRG